MTISVIVPCLDAAPYLPQTLGSLAEQERPPDEVIIVDNGSTDGSLEIARAFADCWPGHVQVLTEHVRHGSRARNVGALAATGDLLMFLDADDVLGPDALAGLAGALSARPGAVAVCEWRRLTDEQGRWMSGPPSCEPRRAGDSPLAGWLRGWYHPPCSVLWTRAAFEEAGRWDEAASINQDGDLMMRALLAGVPLVEATRGCAYYRRARAGQGSVSQRRATTDGLAGRLRALEKIAFLVRYRGDSPAVTRAIADAALRIAREAAPVSASIAGRAASLAAEHRAPLWRRIGRAAAHAGRRRAAAPTPASTTDRSRTEVTAGLPFARRICERAAGGALPPASRFDRPLVSVIVPTYNRAALLRRAVDSVLAQTFQDFELLVVDDASSDDTAAVVATFADTRLRVLRQPRNGGVSAARNRGLREARGEFIAFLDSDDEWMPTKLARQVELLTTQREVGLVYTGVETVRPDGTRTVGCGRERGDVYRKMLAYNVIHGGGSNVLMRREVVAAAGFFDEDMPAIEDYEYWLRVTRFFPVDYVDEPLIRYNDSASADRRSLALRANLAAREWLFHRHLRDMRRAGVAHLFLLKSVRRALTGRAPEVGAARRLALRAVIERPVSRLTLAAFTAAWRARPHDGTAEA